MLWLGFFLAISDTPTLDQVIAWCHQSRSHHLVECQPRSVTSYARTRKPWDMLKSHKISLILVTHFTWEIVLKLSKSQQYHGCSGRAKVHTQCINSLPQPELKFIGGNQCLNTETWELCQLCHHWWHQRLSLWQPLMPPVMTKLASWYAWVFNVMCLGSSADLSLISSIWIWEYSLIILSNIEKMPLKLSVRITNIILMWEDMTNSFTDTVMTKLGWSIESNKIYLGMS